VRRKRFLVEQIVPILKQGGGLVRGGFDLPGGDLGAGLLSLEEAVRLKRWVAKLTLDKTMLQDALAQKL